MEGLVEKEKDIEPTGGHQDIVQRVAREAVGDSKEGLATQQQVADHMIAKAMKEVATEEHKAASSHAPQSSSTSSGSTSSSTPARRCSPRARRGRSPSRRTPDARRSRRPSRSHRRSRRRSASPSPGRCAEPHRPPTLRPQGVGTSREKGEDIQEVVSGRDQNIHSALGDYFEKTKKVFSVRLPRAARTAPSARPKPPSMAQPGSAPNVTHTTAPERSPPLRFWTCFPGVALTPVEPRGPPRKEASRPEASAEKAQSGACSPADPLLSPPGETLCRLATGPSRFPQRHIARFFRSLADIMDAPPMSASQIPASEF